MEKPWLRDFEDDIAQWKPKWEANYDKGVPTTYDYPALPQKDFFNKWTDKHPEKDYLIINDIKLSYGVSNSMARKLANALLDLGVKKGDRVAVMMPNIPQNIISIHACLKIGAIEVPANVLYTTPELSYQFQDSGAETVIVMALFASKAIEIMRDPDTPVKRVIAVQVAGMPVDVEKAENIYDYNELLEGSKDSEPDIIVLPSDISRLQYTGGTTGVPKGCVLTNEMMVSQVVRTSEWGRIMVEPENFRSLTAIPLNHIFGYNFSINLCSYGGGTIILVAQPTPDNLIAAINKHEPNIFASVPAMLIALNNHPEISTSKIGSMEGVISGSAPLAVATMKKFEELSGASICEGYGLSETINIITANPFISMKKYGSCGIVWSDTDIVVVDIETGTKVMPRGELGELICRGPQVIKEYWNNPEETAQVVRDGWLYTGDIVKMDEDGFIYIMDRKKDMIICSGFNVYPRDIDEVLFKHPKIKEACSIGVPHEKRGETVKAFVTLEENETMTEEEVIAFCRENLAPYKVPTLVEFVDAIPRTVIGKADRKAMKEMELSKMEQ